MHLRLAYFSSSEFTLPILESIYQSQGQTLNEVFVRQFTWLDAFQKEKICLNIQPSWWQSGAELLAKLETSNLQEILQKKIALSLVVTAADVIQRGKLIPNPIAQWAQKKAIAVYQPIKINKELEKWQQLGQDLDFALLASFGQILSLQVLKIPQYGFLNWHPSCLPKYRGASPMQAVLKDGKASTALSWLEMTKEMDAGDIWLQIGFKINYTDTFLDLSRTTTWLGAQTWSLPLVAKIAAQKLRKDSI